MESMTHREFLTWNEWLKTQLNTPSRADFYVMRVAAEIRKIYYSITNTKSKVDVNDFKMKIATGKNTKTASSGLTKEQKVDADIAIWMSRVNPK
jgi:hypothetical protein